MSAPDRPTREAVDRALKLLGGSVLAAEVRALRDERPSDVMVDYAERDAVLAHHYRADDGSSPPCCAECLHYDEDGEVRRATWPCATARSLGVDDD